MSGEPEPFSLVVMYTPDDFVVNEEDIYLRGRAIQLCKEYAENKTTLEAIKEIGEELMREGLANVEIFEDTIEMLEEQNFGAPLSTTDRSLIIAYHNLIRKTACKGMVTLPRGVGECSVIPFLPLILEATEMQMEAEIVTDGQSYQYIESDLKSDIAKCVEEPEMWKEISILDLLNATLPTMNQVVGPKSQPLVPVVSSRDRKLKWRESCDGDELRGEEIFTCERGEKFYVRTGTDIRVLYEARPEPWKEMVLGQFLSEYRLLKRNSREADAANSKLGEVVESESQVVGCEGLTAPHRMQLTNESIVVRRSQGKRAVPHLLYHGTTSKYSNVLLWTSWQRLEEVEPHQEEEETEDQKNTRLSIFPMSKFPSSEEDEL